MAPRAEKGTAGSVNGGYAVPNKEQSLVYLGYSDLSLIAKFRFSLFIRAFNDSAKLLVM